MTRYAGVLLGLWAAGSLAAGLVTGAIDWRVGTADRVRRGAFALTLVMVPMTFIGSAAVMGAALFVAGFAIAPTLIATLTLTEETVPPARLTEGIAVTHTGIVAGVAPGATLAGVVIDTAGASPAYLVAVGRRRPGHARGAGAAQEHSVRAPEARRRRTPERRSRWRRLGPREGHRPEVIGATTSAGSRRTAWRSTSPSWG